MPIDQWTVIQLAANLVLQSINGERLQLEVGLGPLCLPRWTSLVLYLFYCLSVRLSLCQIAFGVRVMAESCSLWTHIVVASRRLLLRVEIHSSVTSDRSKPGSTAPTAPFESSFSSPQLWFYDFVCYLLKKRDKAGLGHYPFDPPVFVLGLLSRHTCYILDNSRPARRRKQANQQQCICLFCSCSSPYQYLALGSPLVNYPDICLTHGRGV